MEDEKKKEADHLNGAFKKVLRALEELPPESQRRVIRSAAALLDVGLGV
jgi:hypothetical protein